MEKFRAVLLNVWREACRHIEITESTERIAAMLTRDMPIDGVLVRCIDRQRPCLETVATGPAAPHPTQPEIRTECTASQMKRVLSWWASGRMASRGKGATLRGELRVIVPPGIDGDVLAGPIGSGNRPGVLVLVAAANRTFTTRHEALAEVLLEPFSVALDNDHRLQEMAALREAAEADKRSLLTRLGREKLGDTIVGSESGLRAVMERVELVATSDVPVLIFGDTGTGKELLARAIHARSPRSAGPIHRVNCGAIPPELIDSQLFGHERGAFTGAVETRKGWFERAHGGTLFLDEIGDLPPAAQVRLLRILQDGCLERVGGQQPIHVDVRIVAATHRDLAGMVAEGKFREDLWYRIAVFPMVLPPLRERRQDVPGLARHFAERAAIRFGLPSAMPSPEDVELLVSYDWPGNVRELAAVIDRAAILGEGTRLEIAQALGVATVPRPASTGAGNRKSGQLGVLPQIVPLDAAITEHIEAALTATRGRIEGPYGAASLLDVNPHTLRSKMRKLGIDWKPFRNQGNT
ncbi:MAG TPA: sigma 54-interacting transcriptional regulator [Thermoguttaceae bacterium]|nr:sigma 54-interacting transcriptional regulator [Thermoguttaceae bacterium]